MVFWIFPGFKVGLAFVCFRFVWCVCVCVFYVCSRLTKGGQGKVPEGPAGSANRLAH